MFSLFTPSYLAGNVSNSSHSLPLFEVCIIFLVYCIQYAHNSPLSPDASALLCVLSCSFVSVFFSWGVVSYSLGLELTVYPRPWAPDSPAFPSMVSCQAQFYLVLDNALPTKLHCQTPPLPHCSCSVHHSPLFQPVLMWSVNSFQGPITISPVVPVCCPLNSGIPSLNHDFTLHWIVQLTL